MNSASRLSYWFSGAIALHLLLLAAVWQALPKNTVAPPAKQSARLSLGMAAALAGASAQSATAATAVEVAQNTQKSELMQPLQKLDEQKTVEPKATKPKNKPQRPSAHVKTLTAQKTKPTPTKPAPKPAEQIAKAAPKTNEISAPPAPQKTQPTPNPPQQIAQAASQAGNRGQQGSQHNANL
ncbi:MAG: hypothetical protein ACRC9R_07285, partial [Enterovibrio sp.]